MRALWGDDDDLESLELSDVTIGGLLDDIHNTAMSADHWFPPPPRREATCPRCHYAYNASLTGCPGCAA